MLLRADGSAVLTDFGIAALQDAASLTMTGEVIGTPEYLAPERIRGADLPSSDLWSLGMMLYVCVEGVSPMRRASTLATLAAVLDEPLPAPLRAGPLAAVLAELLVRDPAARPDAERLDRLLAAVAEGTGSAVPREPTRLDRAPASPSDVSPASDRSPSAGRFGPPPPPLPPGPASRPDQLAPGCHTTVHSGALPAARGHAPGRTPRHRLPDRRRPAPNRIDPRAQGHRTRRGGRRDGHGAARHRLVRPVRVGRGRPHGR
ncbi:serine/threonine protein kinase [Streptomyces sp. Mg1]|nr:serine/threonine protein kinase [Streptomyces sp. Mg1]